MTDRDALEATIAATASRSLTRTALRRLARNKAAMASLVVLLLAVLVGAVGPMVWIHDYRTVYANYVRAPASVVPYPRENTLMMSADDALRRARLSVQNVEVEGNKATVVATSDRPIDPRVARYLDRSDDFSNARVASLSADQRTVAIEADVARLIFLFGTDPQGRDLVARTMIAVRISLVIGALATAVALVIGVAWGATAGFLGGLVDDVMMRVVDVIYSLPFIFFVILLVVFFGQNIVLMFVGVGAVEWLDMARIVRGQTLSLRRREFVQAAEALGVAPGAIVRRHIVPNLSGPVIVFVTLLVPKVILLESFLSFLGLGVQEPLTSLGVLISEGSRNMDAAPWMLIYPSLALTLLLFALNFLGDGLRDAFDPRDR